MLLDGIKGVSLKHLQELADNEKNIPKPKGFWFWRRCPLCGERVEYRSTADVKLLAINEVYYEKCSNPNCDWERVSFSNVYPDGEIPMLWTVCIWVGIATMLTAPWLIVVGKEGENAAMFISGFSILGAWGLSLMLAIADDAITGILRRQRRG